MEIELLEEIKTIISDDPNSISSDDQEISAGYERTGIIELLEKIESILSNDYECMNIDGQKCFVASGGVVFHLLVLVQFRSLVIEYADNIEDAYKGLFEDGDLIGIDQDFADLMIEIMEELKRETE